MYTTHELADLLDRHNIYPTQQRIAIMQVLWKKDQHLSAEQILNIVNFERTCVSKATVYNSLRLFVGHGLIREVIVDPTKVFYDSNTHPHHHFYNVDTGRLTDIEPDRLAVSELPEPPEGTVISGTEVIVRVRNNHN